MDKETELINEGKKDNVTPLTEEHNENVPPADIPPIHKETSHPKKSRKKLWIVLGCVVAGLLIAGGLLFYFLKEKKSTEPEKKEPESEKVSMDLIPVLLDEEWGYVNPKGEVVITPQYKYAYCLCDGLALVQTKDDQWGYIDKSGKEIIPAQYKSATPFSEGLAFVVSEGEYPTCIDKEGRTQFTLPQAEYVGSFSEGLAPFVVIEKDTTNKTTALWGFIDKTGKVVVSPQFNHIGFFHEGLAVAEQDGMFGFIDSKGEWVINPQFNNVSSFENGLAAFCNQSGCGIINKKGKYIIKPKFNAIWLTREGLTPVKVGEMWGVCDMKGNMVIQPQFDHAKGFSDGLAAVKQNNKWGYINPKGDITIPCRFDGASDFHNGIAFVEIDEKWGIIDKKGEFIIQPQYKYISPYSDFAFCGWATNDYYDMSALTNNFSAMLGDNTFDGFTTTSTLRTVLNHPSYSHIDIDDFSSYTTRINSREEQLLSEDIKITKTEFNFSGYIGNSDYSYYYGYHKTTNYSTRLETIEYTIECSGKAYAHSDKIIAEIKKLLEKHYGITMEETSYDGYYYLNDHGFSFHIRPYNRVSIYLTIATNSSYLQDLVDY